MMKDYRRLLRLWKQGASTRSMADALGVKRDTVRDALARIGKAYGSLDSVPAEASDEEIQERIRLFVIVFKGTVGGADKTLDLEIKER